MSKFHLFGNCNNPLIPFCMVVILDLVLHNKVMALCVNLVEKGCNDIKRISDHADCFISIENLTTSKRGPWIPSCCGPCLISCWYVFFSRHSHHNKVKIVRSRHIRPSVHSCNLFNKSSQHYTARPWKGLNCNTFVFHLCLAI